MKKKSAKKEKISDEEQIIRWKYGKYLREYVRHHGRRAHISLKHFDEFLKLIGEFETFDSSENEIRPAENLYRGD